MGYKRGSKRPPPRPKIEPLPVGYKGDIKAVIYTPCLVGEEDVWMQFLFDSKRAVGGKWRDVHYATDIPLRTIRSMRDMVRRRRAIGDLTVDRIMERCQPPGWTLKDLDWYTSTDLAHAGIWKRDVRPNARIPGRVYEHRRWYGHQRYVLKRLPPPIETWLLTPVFHVERRA